MGGAAILLLPIIVIAGAIGVFGWMSGWWLTTETDATGEPGSGGKRRGRPVHKKVEDEADQTIVGKPGDPK